MEKIAKVLILMLIIATSVTAIVWWNILIIQREQEVLILDEGKRTTLTNQTTELQGYLVPIGSFNDGVSGYTTSYIFEYHLILQPDLGRNLDLKIEILNLKIGNISYVNATTHKVLNVNVSTNFGTFVSSETDHHTVTTDHTLLHIDKAINHIDVLIITITLTLMPQSANFEEADYLAVTGKTITFEIAFEVPIISDQSA